MTDAATNEPCEGRHGPAVQDGLRPLSRQLRKLIPDVYQGFSQLHGAAMADGAVSVKHKELIALAISVTNKCDGCIAAHARAAAAAGATQEEIAEAIGVCILMNGGPSTVYGPRALAAFNDFAAG